MIFYIHKCFKERLIFIWFKKNDFSIFEKNLRNFKSDPF